MQKQAKWRETGRDESVNRQSKLLPLGCSKQVYLLQQKKSPYSFPQYCCRVLTHLIAVTLPDLAELSLAFPNQSEPKELSVLMHEI